VRLLQQGPDVVASGSGSIDLTGNGSGLLIGIEGISNAVGASADYISGDPISNTLTVRVRTAAPCPDIGAGRHAEARKGLADLGRCGQWLAHGEPSAAVSAALLVFCSQQRIPKSV
jgi:hypothetical protein